MTLNPKQLERAKAILAGRRGLNLADAVAILADHAPFDGMEEEDISAFAEAMLAAASAPPPRLQTGGRDTRGGGAREAPQNPPNTPFRFVSLPDVIVGPEPAGRPALNVPLRAGYCATIELSLTAESPLLIGAPDAEEENEDHRPKQQREARAANKPVGPVMLAGRPVIPGASLRGMLRSVLEIVALGRLGSANLHHRFGFRDFEHPAYGSGDYPVGDVDKVSAGWLTATFDDRGEATGLAIAPCGVHGAGWWHVEIEAWDSLGQRKDWLKQGLPAKYGALGMTDAAGKPTVFNFARTQTFGPPARDNDIGRRWRRKPATNGDPLVPVFAGALPGSGGNKRFEFVFRPEATGAPVPVLPKIASLFQSLSSKRSKNRPEPEGSWKELLPTLRAGQRIPVFYVGDLASQEKGFFFGLTRLFKVPHARDIAEVLRQNAKAGQALSHAPVDSNLDYATSAMDVDRTDVSYRPDFVETLMGYVIEPKDFGIDDPSVDPADIARKGRVACGFLRLRGDGNWKLSDPVALIQSQPRASFSPFYLVAGRGGEADYSAAVPPMLAGRKRYLPRDPTPRTGERLRKIAEMGQRQISRIRTDTSKVQSRLRFLLPRDEGALLTFDGRIRLHNVTRAELGAVLFALTLGEGRADGRFRHMLGRARAFGAGQMRLSSLVLDVRPNFASTETPDVDGCIRAFLDHMRDKSGIPAFPEIPAIQELLFACDPAAGADEEQAQRLDYMALGEFNTLRKVVKPLKDGRPPWQPPAGDEGLLARPGRLSGHLRFWS